ncbi:MAG: hypothetical protein JWL96_3182 [Sphingomonas bacterium]|uniref:DUF7662 domain-containing protein n=1 Tax=Sphingomonas bacterium TaxID=1895847 RepID=UPI00263724A9|nr:hypothetical protein [Sphingomonas bacterium]MDB5711112.1 hypothetical protein [Sphingomonas bacterium]
MAKYDPLSRYLRRRTEAAWMMTFRDIERVINALLPGSAVVPQWWANEDEDSRHVQCHAWREAGYDAFLIGPEQVAFRRRQDTAGNSRDQAGE